MRELADIQKRLQELCEQASRENDSEKVRDLVQRILELLAEQQKPFGRPDEAN